MNILINFMFMVFLGFFIFFEFLFLLWWVGVVLFVVGNVIIGWKDEIVEEVGVVVVVDGVVYVFVL